MKLVWLKEMTEDKKITLRDYQETAIIKFENNGRSGILDMATGTGKTVTSLYAAKRHFEEKQRQFLIVIVPFLHLIDQWAKDFFNFDINYYLEIAYSKNSWVNKLDELIWEYNRGFRKRIVIIGSYKTMATHDFQEKIKKINEASFLIADECHYLGSPQSRYNNFDSLEARLGLSATPRRWWDEEGTEAVNHLFKGIVYSFPMKQAIDERILTQYEYYPIVTNLTLDETNKYQHLSKKISGLISKKSRNEVEEERLKSIILQRTTIIQNAELKQELLIKYLHQQKDKKHTLVYCGKGQVDKIVAEISKLGIRVHRFNAEIHFHEREQILKQFDIGEIEVLVAIKCLDEGVDVPSTRVAYFLSSTSNPREFIQRRGRILRRASGKDSASIYDFVVLPEGEEKSASIFKSIASKELPRFAEFSQFALNEYSAREQIIPYLDHYHLTHLMDVTSWEMYELIKKEGEF
ncbi:hypothetical protein TEHOK1_04220 [Tetragenococcus halophilus]|nr:hypothetical protein TEHOK1_04220 [Tetragenococcus halophilus]